MNADNLKETDLDLEVWNKIKPLKDLPTYSLKITTKAHIFAKASQKCLEKSSSNVLCFRLVAAALVVVGALVFTFSLKTVPHIQPPVVAKLHIPEKPEVSTQADVNLEWDYSVDARAMSRRLVSLRKKCYGNSPKSGIRQRIWRRKLNKRHISII